MTTIISSGVHLKKKMLQV